MLKPIRNVLLTGATGIVGSHVLYELLLERMTEECTGKIILICRGSKEQTAKQRIVNFLTHEHIPGYLNDYTLDQLLDWIEIIDENFGSEHLAVQLQQFKNWDNCQMIHVAATTDLRSIEKAYQQNIKINYEGSLSLFEACKPFIKKFTYISTVYSCGIRQGVITDKYSMMEDFDFRNPYEEFKQKTERKLKKLCDAENIDFQILRPGVVLGRLADEPKYYVPKYNVIYAFAGFFYKLKAQGIDVPINIAIHPNVRMHMVPVDFVAKTILKVHSMDEIHELNIVPHKGLGKKHTAILLDVVGYSNYQFVNEVSKPRNEVEAMYQTKVASSFGTYLLEDEYFFDNTQLIQIMGEDSMPDLEAHYEKMIRFAKDQMFKGLEIG